MRRMLLILGLWVAMAAPSGADEAALAKFYGQYRGKGIAESPRAESMELTSRTMDLSIRPSGNGFEVIWSAVILGDRSAVGRRADRKTSRVVFEVVEGADFYLGRGSRNPASGAALWWARVDGRRMIVQVLQIDRAGKLDHQTYVRTLTETGLNLDYKREEEGIRVRRVRGSFKRVGD